ncbi:DNA polymerase III subunit alpha [Magnetococcales bacterium HHB-1]
MGHAPFVHLHTHTCYSLLSSTLRLEDLIETAKKYKMPALALTDQGNLFAAVKFYSSCLKAGIKPIFGAQIYCVPDLKETTTHPDKESRDQLILLCRNETGWNSLLNILSIGYLEGSHGKPRIDYTVLKKYRQGLIALSGGFQGEVARLLKENKLQEAKLAAKRLHTLFSEEGQNNFYIELHRHGVAFEEPLIDQLVTLAYDLNLPLVASNDTHFHQAKDHRAFDALQCVGLSLTLYNDARPQFTENHHFRSPETMVKLFEDLPEAIENTLQIAKRCTYKLPLGTPMLPLFNPPEGYDLANWLRHESEQGLKSRLKNHVYPRFEKDKHKELKALYDKRLDYELGIIEQMGFPGYFLIVSDFIRWAKEENIPVGPGRGSGAGSLVAWVMQITDIDPIRYTLLFERFLNPERVSMPDFDVDFCMDQRDQVIRYVQKHYGYDRVAQIITYGRMQAKAVIRDVGRVLEFPYGRVDKIAKLVPNVLGITLEKALAEEERFQTLIKEEPEVKELIELALALEGLPRSAGTHAAGVVISNGPTTDTVPLYRDPGSDMPVTQFNMIDVEQAGLVKFDFLGLKTLTVIDISLQLINRQRQKENKSPIDINKIDMEDKKTFDLLKKGNTNGVFQLESSGMQEILKKLAPDVFEDIVALVALYRPGPLGSGMVDDFIDGKHGKIEVVYPLPQLKPILKETYGVILYQEQVMKIAQVLASYSLGGADLLRRAMGKKKVEEMEKQRAIFMKGAEENKVDLKKAEHIFNLMEKFAGYGFNKSHSAAYALISYQTAWLKAHYPVEFLAATLTCDQLNTDKVIRFIRECHMMDIPVLPPDINHSEEVFTVEEGKVRFSLAAIKNVGESAVASMVAVRKKLNRPFQGMLDLCCQVDPGDINRRVLENLIKAGAFDQIHDNRAAMLNAVPAILAQGTKEKRNRSMGFLSLFDEEDHMEEAVPDALEAMPDFNESEKLEFEKSVLGFYISGHPLNRYTQELKTYKLPLLTQLKQQVINGQVRAGSSRDDHSEQVRMVGMIVAKKIHITKKGDRMAFLTLEDPQDQMEVTLFPKGFLESLEVLESDGTVVAEGTVEYDGDTVKMAAERLYALESIREKVCKTLTIQTDILILNHDKTLNQLEEILKKYQGGHCIVTLIFKVEKSITALQLGTTWQVHPKDQLLDEVKTLFGKEACHFKGELISAKNIQSMA